MVVLKQGDTPDAVKRKCSTPLVLLPMLVEILVGALERNSKNAWSSRVLTVNCNLDLSIVSGGFMEPKTNLITECCVLKTEEEKWLICTAACNSESSASHGQRPRYSGSMVQPL